MAGQNARWQRWQVAARLVLAASGLLAGCAIWGVAQGLILALAILSLQQLALLPVFLGLRYLAPGVNAPRMGLTQAVLAWWRECAILEHVFSVLQPFAESREPDHVPAHSAQRGVLLLHGFTCNRGLWNAWLRHYRASGRPCIALSLEPAFGSIDGYVESIDAAMSRLQACTGRAPTIVAHSMGGLAARAWWRHAGHDGGRVHRIITLGTPHAGTLMARFSSARNARQMRRLSRWLEALALSEQTIGYARFECFFSHADQIVCPAGTAVLEGAGVHHVEACGHLSLVFDPRVRTAVASLVE